MFMGTAMSVASTSVLCKNRETFTTHLLSQANASNHAELLQSNDFGRER